MIFTILDGAMLKPIWTKLAEASKACMSNVDGNRSVSSAASVNNITCLVENCVCV